MEIFLFCKKQTYSRLSAGPWGALTIRVAWEFQFFYYKVTAVVNLDGGKIVTVQKAKKDGEKSTKVNMITLMVLMIVIKWTTNEHSDTVD